MCIYVCLCFHTGFLESIKHIYRFECVCVGCSRVPENRAISDDRYRQIMSIMLNTKESVFIIRKNIFMYCLFWILLLCTSTDFKLTLPLRNIYVLLYQYRNSSGYECIYLLHNITVLYYAAEISPDVFIFFSYWPFLSVKCPTLFASDCFTDCCTENTHCPFPPFFC